MSSIFESERIRLSAIHNDNLPQYAEWLSDFSLQRLVNPFMSTPSDVDNLLDPDSWFQRDLTSEKSQLFGVHFHADNAFVGMCAMLRRCSLICMMANRGR